MRGAVVERPARGEGAVGRGGRVEVDELAVAAAPDALAAGDARQRRSAAVEVPRGDPDVDRVQAGGDDVDDLLSIGGGRVVEVADLGRGAVPAQDRSTHQTGCIP